MTRFEIIANRSVQEEIAGSLEDAIDDFYYTVVPVVHGRGRRSRRLGTATWPEENFILVAYVEDSLSEKVRDVVAAVKERFPVEGIRIFELRGT
ncbi:MAG: hypothetical protein CVV51_07825 [Spirochaetae bacterium HGW-Spirochaetae-7]|jgi:hypothetical protein|nr:MAG: hypothetical protein CVV51_07825 [Spirochaetae bacterium HGW-Spirochaetae-7]